MHSWNVTAKEAIEIQKKLNSEIQLEPLPKFISAVAGADVSVQRFGTELYAGMVVLSFPDLSIIEQALIKLPVTFPYIPGLLSFREIPGLLACYRKLKTKPDLILVDGQGIAHPRRLGIAAHLGVILDTPTIGVAKSKLYGAFDEPVAVGESQPIIDPKTFEYIGVALKSKQGSKPLIISPGHKCTIEDALRIVKEMLRGYRLPQPTKEAHALVNRFRRGEIE